VIAPREKRALGLLLRNGERRGLFEPPAELRVLAAASDFTAVQIDWAFELLVTDDGATVGGTADLSTLNGFQLGALVLDGMIEIGEDGQWRLTPEGQAFSDLLSEYADPKYVWRSLLVEPNTPNDAQAAR